MRILRATRLLGSISLLTPFLAAMVWTFYPSLQSTWAVFSMPKVNTTEIWDSTNDPAIKQRLRRQIQQHFLHHSIYIPFDDIYINELEPHSQDYFVSLVMQKSCGRGRLLIWVPFKIRLPIIGEKVFEWCWKPQILGPQL